MKQFVKNISYLASVDCVLKDVNTETELVALPNGAEVVSVNLEVTEEADTGVTCDLGVEGADDFFANDLALDAKRNHQSSVQTTIAKTTTIKIKLSGASAKGKITLRVLYFLPSKILAEYN